MLISPKSVKLILGDLEFLKIATFLSKKYEILTVFFIVQIKQSAFIWSLRIITESLKVIDYSKWLLYFLDWVELMY